MADPLWHVRDLAIRLAFGVSRSTLNPSPGGAKDGQAPSSPLPLARELRLASMALKAAALKAGALEAGADGRPDYSGLANSPVCRELEALAPGLAGVDLDALRTRDERLAFWLNCYNALTIHAVAAGGIRQSVGEGRGGLLGFFARAAYRVGGRRYSLEDMEQGILRANRGHPRLPGPHFRAGDARRQHCLATVDPRVHFALHCGAQSCPMVGALDADAIEAGLEAVATAYLQGPQGLSFDREAGTLMLPKVMDWYAIDFGGHDGLVPFATPYIADAADRAALQRGPVTLRFREYDWALG